MRVAGSPAHSSMSDLVVLRMLYKITVLFCPLLTDKNIIVVSTDDITSGSYSPVFPPRRHEAYCQTRRSGVLFPAIKAPSLMRQADESGRHDVLDGLMANARSGLQNTSACLLKRCSRD